MKRPSARALGLAAIALPLLGLFVVAALRTGPLAPVAVTTAAVETRALAPALFGIATVEARQTYKLGPTLPARVLRLTVDVGDRVAVGQVLGELDPVDLAARIQAQEAAQQRAEAQLTEAGVQEAYARGEAARYERLVERHLASEELAAAKRQSLRSAEAALAAARQERARARAEGMALEAQRLSLRLVAPVDGLVVSREAEPGSTVVAGQTVLELVAPESLWLSVRFDQSASAGLAAGLPARVSLRSRNGEVLPGRVLRREPKADAVTEETLAKVVFERLPEPLPPLGELAEVTVALPARPAAPVVPNAALRREGEALGVWRLDQGAPRFVPVELGMADLEGRVEVRAGLQPGERVIVHSEKALSAHSRLRVLDRLPGVAP
ncbi:MAG: efflux RND transporter periplasmic adaptor subunit [Gammaproteobacteria bacterium]|nr:efflux RND transporter periplasmic adaptor subunit [Gammaproteobacteria bacterium]